jgi:hypothetical protein
VRTEVLERRALVKALFEMPYKVGDILHHSWGYEQTNCDFYEVVAVKGQSVGLRKIAHQQVSGGGSAMSAMVMPIKGQYVDSSNNALEKHETRGRDPDKVIVKRVGAYMNGGESLRYFVNTPYGWCGLWEGSPCYESWYA